METEAQLIDLGELGKWSIETLRVQRTLNDEEGEYHVPLITDTKNRLVEKYLNNLIDMSLYKGAKLTLRARIVGKVRASDLSAVQKEIDEYDSDCNNLKEKIKNIEHDYQRVRDIVQRR